MTTKRIVDLHTDGGHSAQRTKETAEVFSGIARYFYYATAPGSGGLEYPADVYELLGTLSEAAARLAGVADNLRLWMTVRASAQTLKVDEGQEDDLMALLERFAGALKGANLTSVALSQEFSSAQSAITHVAGIERKDYAK